MVALVLVLVLTRMHRTSFDRRRQCSHRLCTATASGYTHACYQHIHPNPVPMLLLVLALVRRLLVFVWRLLVFVRRLLVFVRVRPQTQQCRKRTGKFHRCPPPRQRSD
jgi:hypothetical protein